jgi:membrane-associated phospholipid phosphatase
LSGIRKILFIVGNLAVWALFSFHFAGMAFSANDKIGGNVNIQPKISSENSESNFNQKPAADYFQSDTIQYFNSSKGYFSGLLHNFGEQATAPFHFKAREWIITGAAVGITAALISVDGEIDSWARVQKQQHPWVAQSSPVITSLGGSYGIYSVAAFGLFSAVADDQKGVSTCLLASQAMITSGAWVRIIKLIAGRERPMADYMYSKSEGGKWYGPLTQYDQDTAHKKTVTSFDSFPSGHTATAFAIATVFASQYSDTRIVPIICYSTAGLVGITRLTEHEHWASDVFVGGLLGYVCGRQVVSHYNRMHQNPYTSLPANPKSKAQFSFIQKGNQVGLALKW